MLPLHALEPPAVVCSLALHAGEDVLVGCDEEPALPHRNDQLVCDLVGVRVGVRVGFGSGFGSGLGLG